MLDQPASAIQAPSRLRVLALSAALLLIAGAAVPSAALAQGSLDPDGDPLTIEIELAENDLGQQFLVGYEGTTLYYFTRDVLAGTSGCGGLCATLWPPLLVADDAELLPGDGVDGTLGLMVRDDGKTMATYRGRPLYYYSKDEIAGKTKGHGLGGVWFVAREDGSAPATPPALSLELASGELGEYLVDGDGMTLYYFADDTSPGKSACTNDCLEAWPPLMLGVLDEVAAGDGVTGVVGRMSQDGSLRVTYDGRPLYYFAGDLAAGDTNGQGFGDAWYVAGVDGLLR